MKQNELQALRALATCMPTLREPEKQYLLGIAKGLELAAAKRQAQPETERAGA